MAFSLWSSCALAIAGPACAATEPAIRHDLPVSDSPAGPGPDRAPLAIFLTGETADDKHMAQGSAPAVAPAADDEAGAMASGVAAGVSPVPEAFHAWVAVDGTVLEEMRGGFDIAPGLKVSFGIERIVNLNGVLQTATRIEVPDAGRLVQVMQSPAAPSPVMPAQAAAAGQTSAPPANAPAAPDEKISLPVTGNFGNGAATLIQNGGGNAFFSSVMSPEAAATIIQNSASNQTIQSLTVINAATNSLELLKGANLHTTLLDALTRSASAP